MDVYGPFQMTPEESKRDSNAFAARVEGMAVSDRTLADYVSIYDDAFRRTLEEFFPSAAKSVPLYARYPFHATVVRLGPNGVFIARRPNDASVVEVVKHEDILPHAVGVNIFDIARRLNAPFLQFDTTIRSYDDREADAVGVKDALASVLEFFWVSMVPNETAFSSLCCKLLEAEGVTFTETGTGPNWMGDAAGTVLLDEPGGFRRFEKWLFEFKLPSHERVSAAALRQVEEYLFKSREAIDVVCLVTSGNLTSVGNYITSENPRVRVWDQRILNLLANAHPAIIGQFFSEYPEAVAEISRRAISRRTETASDVFQARLAACPTGRKHFAEYEKLGTELFVDVFEDALGPPKSQCVTQDRKQRRDVLFRNRRKSGFWERVFSKFSADFVIVDFKNYADLVEASEIFDVAKYANKAIGRFVVLVCRKGASDAVLDAQLRVLRDNDIAIIVVCDEQLVEMATRKEAGELAEDVLEDVLDELLRRY